VNSLSFKNIEYNELLNEAVSQLSKGAFLTVKSGDKVNTMTIAWGMIGFIWKKPIFQVLVRESRYTHELIEESEEFTVSIPINGEMQKELSFCGSKSGRDLDKLKACELHLVEGQKVNTPVIEACSLHYECRIVAKQTLLKEHMLSDLVSDCYKNNDLHTLYYGEIVACYIKE
jgi:flavin reductase (DIM6/NTAB) family NADH-FMN oxidoreductase RutF